MEMEVGVLVEVKLYVMQTEVVGEEGVEFYLLKL